MYASRGFACLAIAYFNYGDLPKTTTKFDLEYFEEAVEYLLKQPDVIPDRCGVVCSSMGGEIGLAMSIYLPRVKAVVSIGGSFLNDFTLTYRGRELWQAVKPDPTEYQMDEQLVDIRYTEKGRPTDSVQSAAGSRSTQYYNHHENNSTQIVE